MTMGYYLPRRIGEIRTIMSCFQFRYTWSDVTNHLDVHVVFFYSSCYCLEYGARKFKIKRANHPFVFFFIFLF